MLKTISFYKSCILFVEQMQMEVKLPNDIV